MKCIGFVAGLLPFWHPIMTVHEMRASKIHSLSVMGVPLVGYVKNDSYLVVHSDVCPHMGGSFCKGGWVNPDGNLQCPYHGFEFDEGSFVSIPSSGKRLPMKRPTLSLYPILEKNGFVYLFPDPNQEMMHDIPEPYFPPEHTDPEFVAVSGTRVLSTPTDSLVENLLDMLHISYVHSFGNADLPLPTNIRYEEMGDLGGRTRFEYYPNSFTISTRVGKTNVVRVENEFHMGTTTLTRVIAGDTIKTVFTQSIPISKTETRLFWTVYRNFWRDPNTASFNGLGDTLLRLLMEKTIDEDASILSRSYPEGREGFLTKYDVTIKKYREKREQFALKNRRFPFLPSSFDI